MKGIIQAYALFVVLMGLALGFMLYIRIDSIQYMSRLILNQSVQESLVELDRLSISERVEKVSEIVNRNINIREYGENINVIEIIGFHPEPLVLRVKLGVNGLGIEWVFDETMIEVDS